MTPFPTQADTAGDVAILDAYREAVERRVRAECAESWRRWARENIPQEVMAVLAFDAAFRAAQEGK